MSKAILSAIEEEPSPRSAMCIALILHGEPTAEHRLDVVLDRLRVLELEGQVRSFVDGGSVVRWVLVEPEEGPAMELGAQVLIGHRFEPTPVQTRRLGL